MNRNSVLNFFAVARCVALAIATTGLIVLLGYLAAVAIMRPPLGASMGVVYGSVGFLMLIGGMALALLCSLTRVFVARTRFRSD